MTSGVVRRAVIAAAFMLFAGPASAQTAQTQPRTQQKQTPAPQQLAAPAADSDVVARVGTREVKGSEIRSYIASLAPREQAAIAADPSLLTQAVRNYLVNELVLSAALARKWDQRPEIAARLEKVRRDAVADSFLDGLSQPPADYPPESEILALYDANKTQFVTPRQFQVAQIFIAAKDKAAEDKGRIRLEEVVARLKQPNADFASALRDGAGKEAGDRNDEIGWVPEGQLRPEIREQVAGLAKGGVSAPLKLEDGWHILRLIDTRPSDVLPVDAVRPQLTQRLRQERAAQLRRAAIQDLVRQSPAAINELALSRLAPEPQSTAATR